MLKSNNNCGNIIKLGSGDVYMGRKIIGLTGAFGSGSSFLAKHFFEKKGYKRCSLSSALREKYKSEKGDDAPNRSALQDYGNHLRQTTPNILAQEADKIIVADPETNFVIESIRNPAEIDYFRLPLHPV